MFPVSDITTNSAAAALTSGSDSSSSAKAASNSQTTKDQFLKMLVAQLQHQDPLTPPDATQFANQMTSFGQLEQLFNINSTLGNLVNSGSATGRYDAVSMIGKKVEAVGNELEVGAASASDIGFQLGKAAEEVTVTVKDAAGQTLRTIRYSDQSAGTHHYAFDGKGTDGQALSPGTYKLEVAAVDSQGVPLDVDPLTVGTVTGVDFSSGTTQLLVGSRVLSMEQITSVRS